MFQMQPTREIHTHCRRREREKETVWWAKKWQHKIDFTCKSLFDSNVVDTFASHFHIVNSIFFFVSSTVLWKMAFGTVEHAAWNLIPKRQRTPFWHRKNYANEITCKLSAQHATTESQRKLEKKEIERTNEAPNLLRNLYHPRVLGLKKKLQDKRLLSVHFN